MLLIEQMAVSYNAYSVPLTSPAMWGLHSFLSKNLLQDICLMIVTGGLLNPSDAFKSS